MDDLDKNAKCNKILRKAVQVGDIDMVELILTIATDKGRNIFINQYDRAQANAQLFGEF